MLHQTTPEQQLTDSELDLITVQVICQSYLHANKDVALTTEKTYERYTELQRKQAWVGFSSSEETEMQNITRDAKNEEDKILTEKGLTDKHSPEFIAIKKNLQTGWNFHYADEEKRKGKDDTTYSIRQKVASYMQGVDLTKPVEIITIPKGTLLGQYKTHGRSTGQWFSLVKKSDGRTAARPHTEYGIASMSPTDILVAWKERNDPSKQLQVFEATDDIQALKSVASAIADTFTYAIRGENPVVGRAATKGGAEQVVLDKDSLSKIKHNPEQERIVNQERRSVPVIIKVLRRNVEKIKAKKNNENKSEDSDDDKIANMERKSEISVSDSDSDSDVEKDNSMEVRAVKSKRNSPRPKNEWNIETLKSLVDKIIVIEEFYNSLSDETHAQDLKDLVALAKGLVSSAEVRKENIEPHFEALVLILRHEFDQLHQQKLRDAITLSSYMEFLNKNSGHHYARMIGLALKEVYAKHPDIYKNHPEADKKFPRDAFKKLDSLQDYENFQTKDRYKKLAENFPKILFDPHNANMSFHGFYNKKTHDIIVAPIPLGASLSSEFSFRDMAAEMMQLNKSDFLNFDLIPNGSGSFHYDHSNVAIQDRIPTEEAIKVRERILSSGPLQPAEKVKAQGVMYFLNNYLKEYTSEDGGQPFKDKFSIKLNEKEKIFVFEFTQKPYSSDDKKLMRKLLFEAMHIEPKSGFSLFNKTKVFSEEFFEENGCKMNRGTPIFTLQMEKLTKNQHFSDFMAQDTKIKSHSLHN